MEPDQPPATTPPPGTDASKAPAGEARADRVTVDGDPVGTSDAGRLPPPVTASPWRFRRATDDRVLLGVAGGLGQRIGVDPLVIRIALVVLTLAGGAGVVVYGLGWLLSEEPPDGTPPPPPATLDLRQASAVGLVALGLTLLLRGAGIWFSDALVWPALIAGSVSAIIWTRSGPDEGTRGRLTESTPARIVLAAVLTFAGLVSFWLIVPDPRRVVVPLAGIVIGVGLLVTPLLARIWRNLEAERSQRARQAARDEVAAHLHDSVLQTLALVQRTTEHRRAVTLARTQERELRSWLYGDREPGGPSRDLEAAVDDLLAEIETGYDLTIDHVVVGNVAHADADLRALVNATREALVNVAKHAGVDTASLYVEVEEDRVTTFVRDRGHGFDPSTVGDDRHGLRHSIHARLQRHGGGAHLTTSPDGTEVECWVPVERGLDDATDGPATDHAPDWPDAASTATDPPAPRPPRPPGGDTVGTLAAGRSHLTDAPGSTAPNEATP